MTFDPATLTFRLPGWESATFRLSGSDADPWLELAWTLPDSDGGPNAPTVRLVERIGTLDPVDVGWWLLKRALLHEAGEHYRHGDTRPWHPHAWTWWDEEGTIPPEALHKGTRRE